MWRQSSNHEFAFWDAKLNAPAMTTCKEIKQIKGIIKAKNNGTNHIKLQYYILNIIICLFSLTWDTKAVASLARFLAWQGA